ncbi:MAG: fatty acid desaturase [Planctomycetia bacterium]|nr:fatty acid desaturase [Planctomycetia bacterium]
MSAANGAAGNGANLDAADMGTSGLAGRAVLEIGIVRTLSRRSDARGLGRFAVHLGVMTLTGLLVYECLLHARWLLLPALVVHGFTIVTMFAPMHECVHRTAFAAPILNEIFGWLAGLLGFYNFHYYRYYHTWHHRYTQDTARDPELMTPKPRNRWEYFVEVSGLSFWLNRPALFLKLATGRLEGYAFIPVAGRRKVALSAACQLAVYLLALGSIAAGYYYAWWFWFLPAIVAQPLLRMILIVEHTGCTSDENGLTNTRTTLASWPVRLLMWNMSFHAEHHLYPSISFHQLPQAHRELSSKLTHIAPSYVSANRTVLEVVDALAVADRSPASTPSSPTQPSER